MATTTAPALTHINVEGFTEPQIPTIMVGLLAAIEEPVAYVKAVMAVLDSIGYDSYDREQCFQMGCNVKGWNYETLYNAWLDN
jgi:hypothetical protein